MRNPEEHRGSPEGIEAGPGDFKTPLTLLFTDTLYISPEQTPGEGEGQGSLLCCSSWGCKESDRTKRLNNNIQPEK